MNDDKIREHIIQHSIDYNYDEYTSYILFPVKTQRKKSMKSRFFFSQLLGCPHPTPIDGAIHFSLKSESRHLENGFMCLTYTADFPARRMLGTGLFGRPLDLKAFLGNYLIESR